MGLIHYSLRVTKNLTNLGLVHTKQWEATPITNKVRQGDTGGTKNLQGWVTIPIYLQWLDNTSRGILS